MTAMLTGKCALVTGSTQGSTPPRGGSARRLQHVLARLGDADAVAGYSGKSKRSSACDAFTRPGI
jgi:hypothetical protein